jgi:hypothetical protein
MTTLRSNMEPDQQRTTDPAAFIAERNEHEVRCGMCSRAVYVDEETFCFATEAMESGLDNPFRCEVCKEEYDDLAYEG